MFVLHAVDSNDVTRLLLIDTDRPGVGRVAHRGVIWPARDLELHYKQADWQKPPIVTMPLERRLEGFIDMEAA